MQVALYSSGILEILAAVIITAAAARAFFVYGWKFATDRRFPEKAEHIRFALGKSLSLALELLLGADIIKTAVAPSWNALGILAAIAILRTALNYFLEKELEKAKNDNNTSITQ